MYLLITSQVIITQLAFQIIIAPLVLCYMYAFWYFNAVFHLTKRSLFLFKKKNQIKFLLYAS